MSVERVAKIGEIVTGTASEGAVLTAHGLGSCIGLAIVDGRVAGLAHILLPGDDRSHDGPPGKRAHTAVPALVEALLALGTARSRMEVALVGGAKMFSFGDGANAEIGGRNEQAVRAALENLRIPVLAAATGGQTGRTVKVDAAQGLIEVKAAGAERAVLHHCARGRVPV